jgi:hypothetical protein
MLIQRSARYPGEPDLRFWASVADVREWRFWASQIRTASAFL